jgi:hypothetical protein|tara:strand:+ start:533 stop:778 length:246 start_codon:yes stop_codon:yes gene_type:complete
MLNLDDWDMMPDVEDLEKIVNRELEKMKKQFYKIEIICEWDNKDKLTLGSLMASDTPPKSIDITPIDINDSKYKFIRDMDK